MYHKIFAWMLTHPIPAGNTTWGVAFLRTPPQQSVCAGRSPRKASRSSYSSAGTGGRTSAACSSPGREEGSDVSFHSFTESLNAEEDAGYLQNRHLCVPVSWTSLWARRRWWSSSARTTQRGFCGALSSDSSDSCSTYNVRNMTITFWK